jgi:hypothetical protein
MMANLFIKFLYLIIRLNVPNFQSAALTEFSNWFHSAGQLLHGIHYMDLLYCIFFILERVCFPGCEAIHTQAYSFHKAGSPLRFAYASSCFGQVCYVTHRKLCFCYWISDSYSYDCDMVVHCWRMGLVASSFCFVVFYLFCNVQTQLGLYCSYI